MSSIFQLIILIPTTVLVLIWIICAVKYEKKFESFVATIDKEQFQFSEFFYIGFQIMEWIHFNIKSDKNRKKVSEMAEIYGAKYAEYYYYVMMGGQITYIVTLFPVIFLLALLSNDMAVLAFGVVLAVLVVWYVRETFNDKIEERREELLMEFPQVLSKITLLVNAGMVLRDAWKKVAFSGEGVIYTEMQTTVHEFENGISEIEAYRHFADRCALKEMRKFAALVEQGIMKGSSDLAKFLRDMSDEMWAQKKGAVIEKAGKAGTKLVMCTGLVFVGILIMIIVPAFSSL